MNTDAGSGVQWMGDHWEGDLRSCIDAAYSNNDVSNRVTFASGVQRISLVQGQLDIKGKSLTIDSLAELTIDAHQQSRVFLVDPGANLSLSGLTITGGQADCGGGIFNNYGTLKVQSSTISGNTASVYGGGVCSFIGFASGTTTLTDSTLAGNTATYGGGLFSWVYGGAAKLSNCTLAYNTAAVGGGVYSDVRNTPSYPNTPSYIGTMAITNSTLAYNTASILNFGGGVFSGISSGGSATINNTIVAGNSDPGTASDILNSSGAMTGDYNMTGDANAPGSHSLRNAKPLLAKLANYGGPTDTMPLLPGSAGMGAGDPSGNYNTDQRGMSRSGAVDIGACQSQGFTMVVSGGDYQTAWSGTQLPVPFTVTVKANYQLDPVQGGLVTFGVSDSCGTFPCGTKNATIDAYGVATAPAFTVGSTAGDYTFSPTAAGVDSCKSPFHVSVVSAMFDGNNLIVNGTGNSDTINVNFITDKTNGNYYLVAINNLPVQKIADKGGAVIIYGNGGDDSISVTGNALAVLVGGAGNDTLTVDKSVTAVMIGGTTNLSSSFLAAVAQHWKVGNMSDVDAVKASITDVGPDWFYGGGGNNNYSVWAFGNNDANSYSGIKTNGSGKSQITMINPS
jgi:hypothetical protein